LTRILQVIKLKNTWVLLSLSWLQGISAAGSDGQLTADVSKAHARAENDTRDPSADRKALLRNACSKRILQPNTIQDASTE
jgi:hypothetical protein